MNEPLNFRLGIIGGCMSSQVGIPFSKLYHRQLAAIIDRETGIHLKAIIGRDFESEYSARFNNLLNRTCLNGVLLHMRVTFQAKAGLVAMRDHNDTRQYFLHPNLFNRHRFGWVQNDVDRSPSMQVAERDMRPEYDGHNHGKRLWGPRIAGFRLWDANWIIGSLVGLDKWAIEDELRMLVNCQRACIEANIPLFVLGPTPVGNSNWRYRLCQKMNATLKTKLPGMKIPFVCFEPLIDRDGRPLIKEDGIHLTEHGHTYVAHLLADKMIPWITSLE